MKAQILPPEELTEVAINMLKDRLIHYLDSAITRIIFFGSRQKGEFTPDSDIDIVVREKNSSLINKIFEIADRIERSLLSYRLPLFIHVQSEDEYRRFNRLKNPFMLEITEKGKIIYERTSKS